ncbi:hypothetical protein BK138_32215 [Paenibacillus rhizosphaerae]|uniref:Uncharacterized protein n=2 Tax=Paenibacillus TaxID=44249 RepID=A0A1R1E6E6_9BACL|nr:hypothetical protein BK138_32215 [Paenibacillus rhizosphaerae]
MSDDGKAGRILYIYDRLQKGLSLNKEELVDRFQVTAKTIQRDIDEVRNYYADHYTGKEVVYNRRNKVFEVESDSDHTISAVDVFVLVKILLDSRAFNNEELNKLYSTLCATISKSEEQAFHELVRNEKFHYQPIRHGKPILDTIWDLGQCIKKQVVIEISYTRMDGTTAKRVVHPLAIVFSEFYFYLIAKIEDREHETPTFYRVDRMEALTMLGRRYRYTRFEDGELKKRVQFMYGGPLITVRLMCKMAALEAVMDRLPTANLVENTDEWTTIEAEVFGTKGCSMWLLGQGDQVKVLGPEELKQRMRDLVAKVFEDSGLITI